MPFATQVTGFALFVALVACRDDAPSSRVRSVSSTAALPAPGSLADAAIAAPAPAASAPAPLAVHGTVTLVLERVDAVCTDPDREAHRIGNDLFLQVDPDDAPGFKPPKDFVFCPKPPRGELRLGTWQNCSAFPSCHLVADETSATADGGASGKVTVQCGKEQVVLESDGHQTTVRGSFGTRVLSPTPMKIAPLKTRTRKAWVDC